MTERESIQRALAHLHASDGTLKKVMNVIDKERSAKSVKHASRMTLRTALIAALIAALGIITALAASEGGFLQVIRNNFNVRDRAPDAEIVQMLDVETGEALFFVNSDVLSIISDDEDGNATSYTVSFVAGENTPKMLGDWRLGNLPNGYEQAGFSLDDQRCEILYLAHPEGKTLAASIRFSYELPGSKTTFYRPCIVENVIVNGDEGLLIKGPIGMEGFQSQKLYWFSSDTGIGFILDYYGVPELDQIDLLELAQSVVPNSIQ